MSGDNATAQERPDEINCPKCYAVGHGGGLYNSVHAILIINKCRIHKNFSSGFGGEVFNDGFIDFSDMYIEENNSRQSGGGIYNGGTMQGDEIEIIKNITGPGYDGYSYSFGAPGIDGESPGGGGLFNAGYGCLINSRIQ